MDWVRTGRGVISSLAVLGHLAVPVRWPRIREFETAQRLERGCTWVLPGIDGRSPLNRGLARGLADGGVAGAIPIFDWTTGLAPLFPIHLRSRRLQACRSAELAGQIVAYQDAYPDRPVQLIAHSGGTEIVLAALETLPSGRTVDAVILLAAAVSPQRDLGRALARCQRGLWSFHSRRDWFYLGIGTLVAGTSDGQHTFAAGNAGFESPHNADDATTTLYRDRLHQIHFTSTMRRSFHCGGHVSWTNRVFAADWIAPLILNQTAVAA